MCTCNTYKHTHTKAQQHGGKIAHYYKDWYEIFTSFVTGYWTPHKLSLTPTNMVTQATSSKNKQNNIEYNTVFLIAYIVFLFHITYTKTIYLENQSIIYLYMRLCLYIKAIICGYIYKGQSHILTSKPFKDVVLTYIIITILVIDR